MADDNKKKQSEYNSLKRSQSSKQSQYDSAIRFNASIDRKISRLRNAYTRLGVKREDYRELKRREKRTIDDKDLRWKGINKQVFDSSGGHLKTAEEKYYKELDRVRDEINNEINRLRKQKYSDSWLGNLQRQISDLGTKIRNFFN